MWQAILAGGSIGLLSSFHCVGMCGPLALSLPVMHLPKWLQPIALMGYHLGRVSSYALLGLVFGLAGQPFFIAGWQQFFSILLGGTMLLLAIQYYFFNREWQPSWILFLQRKVQGWMTQFLQSGKISGYWMLGMANALLPCGMVYVALAGALAAGSLQGSVVFMLSFGGATLPAMLLLGWAGLRMDLTVRRQIKKLMPFFVGAVAVVLILRGMNLGIPFISPVLPSAMGQAIPCH